VNSVENCFLYGIVDLNYVAQENVVTVTEQLVRGGVDILQLRAKGVSKSDIAQMANAMLRVTQLSGVPLILNDHPDLLSEVHAEGCHVGQEDVSIAEARNLAGRPCIVGKSTHSLEQAIAAEKEGADYIGFGPVFPTATKPSAQAIGTEKIHVVHNKIKIPIYCIGGVKLSILECVKSAGAQRVCIVSDLLLAEDLAKHTAEVKKRLLSGGSPIC
jgi:thiamine-phosphate pyrophosphorylase